MSSQIAALRVRADGLMRSRSNTAMWAVLGLAALEAAVMVGLRLTMTGTSPLVIAASGGVGLLFVIAGVLGRRLRPASGMGSLMILVGLLWNAGRLQGEAPFAMVVLALPATSIGVALIVYMLFAAPSGRLASRRDRAIAALALLAGIRDVPGIGGDNPMRDVVAQPLFGLVAGAANVVGLLTIGAAIVIAVRRWTGSSAAARRPLAPVYAAALAVAVRAMAQEALVGAGVVGKGSDVLKLLELGSFALVPIGVLVGLARAHLARTAIADLVIELGQTPEPARLRAALSNALGDPRLEVLRWSEARESWLDETDQPIEPGARAGDRAITLLERDGHPLAAILHDAALLDDPGLMPSVATAMRLEVENEALQAEVERQLAEVRRSRARIVEAGDAERRRVERNLHDGAQQRLVSLTLALRLLRSKLGPDSDPAVVAELDAVTEELKTALAELRELARGIHPAVLGQAGLGAALLALADRSPVPVVLEEAPEERLPETVETTAYYVAAEGLTNVAKYAQATSVSLRASCSDGSLTIEVSDDGIGGADAARGSGLRGLADRVEAIGGHLTVLSPMGGGTRLVAVLPLAPQPAEPARP